MKFSCEKLLLQNAVNTTSRAVAAKSSIPALEGLLLQCGDGVLTVSGYNMQTGIRTRFPVEEQEGGELVLSARLFGDIIRRMPDDMITFSSDDKLVVHLSCGDADFDILALSAADFPSCRRSRRSIPYPCRKDAALHDPADLLRRLHERGPSRSHGRALRDRRQRV